MPQDRQERRPAVPRDVTGIDPDTDARVRVLGTVIEAREDSIMLDDGSGTVEVFVDADVLDQVAEGQRIRVFGRVLPTADAFEVQGEVVQDMTDLDMDAYQEVADMVGTERIP